MKSTLESLPSKGIQPRFKEGTCELESYAVFNAKGIAEVSHETSASFEPSTRIQCFLLEAKGKAILA